MNQELTIKEAIEQGYELAFTDGGGWESPTPLSDLTEEDFENESWVLAEKESRHYTLSDDWLYDELLNQMASEEDDIGDDTGQAFDALNCNEVRKLCEEFTIKINDILKKETNYKLSARIYIIPG